jgi:chain length determinant protein EpsF
MVMISYACPQPERCARVANAVAAAYTDTNLEMRVMPARENAQWFDARTRTLRDKLETAQRTLSDYQRKHGIVATDERLDVETARLDELSRQLVTVQTEASGSRSWRNNMGRGETLPEVVASPLIATLKGELARLDAQHAQTAARLGRNHPERVRTEREIASLRQRIALETSRIAGSIDTTDEVNTAREAALREAVERQKQQVLELKGQRDEIAVLQKDVERAQQVYDLVTGRLAETSLEGQTQQTNVFMLAPATAPSLPSSPRRRLMVALSLVLGALVGVGLALGLELMRRRVRSEADLVDALGVPVIGVLPRALIAPPPRALIGPPR